MPGHNACPDKVNANHDLATLTPTAEHVAASDGGGQDLRQRFGRDPDALDRMTAWRKAGRSRGDTAVIHRRASDDDAVTADRQIARHGDRVVVFAGLSATSPVAADRA